MSKLKIKIVSIILVSSFVFSPVFATKARAQWLVFDPSNFANTLANMLKDYGLDAIAWQIANVIIERISASTVEWINRGFKGQPAYVTDPGAYFGDIGDKVAGQFIFNNPNLNFLCGPIQNKVKLALTKTYNRQNQQWRCTLTDVVGNMENFLNDFERGGWDKFWRISQERGNNPLGAYIQAESDLYEMISGKQGEKQKELDFGRGFMSQKKCIRWSQPKDVMDYDDNGNLIYVPQEPVCIKEETVTPGSVIETKLNDVLGLGTGKLEVADEINEIVSSLLSQLIQKVVGGGKGLRSLSEEDESNDYEIFTKTLSERTATSTFKDYFGNEQNLDTLDQQVPTTTIPKDADLIYPKESASSTQPFQQP